jgi:hypothetical protein
VPATVIAIEGLLWVLFVTVLVVKVPFMKVLFVKVLP